MLKIAVLGVTAGVLLTAGAAAAQPNPPESDGRYSFHKVDNGFLRLDSRTGQVSICNHKTLGWACETVPDERTALESEIARLQDSNAALKKEMLSRGLRLPDAPAPRAPSASQEPQPDQPKQGDGELRLPSQADVDRVMTFVERVWRRLMEMMNNVQKDVPGQT